MKILLIEDDLDLGNGVRIALLDQGWHVVWVRRVCDANHALDDQTIDLVLLDLGLPDGDGLQVLKAMRRDRRLLPDALNDRLAGLDNGADDYLIKPFALAELLSRVRALARRSFGMDGETLALRGLVLHEAAMRASVDGLDVGLSRTEFLLLSALVKRPDRVVTRRALEEQVMREATSGGSNVLDVHMSNLRKKIGSDYVRTVRGLGYVIDRQARQQLPKP
jgi:two-component system, OmpR family, response regulator QseB